MAYLCKLMDNFSKHFLRIAMTLMLVIGLVVKPMYSFADAPYFEWINFIDIVTLLFSLFCVFLVYHFRQMIQDKLSYRWCFVLFLIFACIYIILVPLKPFSDMQHIFEGAVKFSEFEWREMLQDSYWQKFSGNLKLAVFWGIILIPFPKTTVIIKIINVIFLFIIACLIGMIAKEYKIKYYKSAFLITLCFFPLNLYINHIYFDLPYILLVLGAIAVYKKYDNIFFTALILGLASFLRISTIIFALALSFDYIFKNYQREGIKKSIIRWFIAVFLFATISSGLENVVSANFVVKDKENYSGWNQIYIGLNEPKLGFMDGDFSNDRDLEDVLNRVKEYGAKRTALLIGKKTFWLWMQGTFQVQRYAFGLDTQVWMDKFEYETFAVKYLLNDTQVTRKFINSFMRSQYLAVFVLMVFYMWKSNTVAKDRVFYYIMMATFLIMLVYELKSRYILHCLPGMILMAVASFEILEKYRIRRR